MLRFRPLTFSKAELAAVPDEHRVAYIALGQIATECFILKRLAISALNSASPPQPQLDAAHATALFATRMLGRLVWESQNTLNSREVAVAFKALSQSAPTANPVVNEDVDRATTARVAFNQALKRSPILERLRNELGAHVDLELNRESFAKLPEQTPLVDHWTEMRGNAVYGASTAMHVTAFAAIQGVDDFSQALGDAVSEVLAVAGHLAEFIEGFMVAFVVTHFGVEWLQAPHVILEGVPALDELRAPLFFTAKA